MLGGLVEWVFVEVIFVCIEFVLCVCVVVMVDGSVVDSVVVCVLVDICSGNDIGVIQIVVVVGILIWVVVGFCLLLEYDFKIFYNIVVFSLEVIWLEVVVQMVLSV